MLSRRPAGLHLDSDILRRILNAGLGSTRPTPIVRFLEHVLADTEQPFHDCFHLKAIVQVLRVQQPTPDQTRIVEQALRLGCSDAPAW